MRSDPAVELEEATALGRIRRKRADKLDCARNGRDSFAKRPFPLLAHLIVELGWSVRPIRASIACG